LLACLIKLGDVGDSPVGGSRLPPAATDNSEKPVLSPVGTPAVTAEPEVDPVLVGAVAIDLNSVVGSFVRARIIHVHTSSIGLNTVGIQIGGNGAASGNLHHNVLITGNRAVLGDGDDRVAALVHSIAPEVRVTVSADVDRRAVVIHCLVLLASYIRDSVLMNPPVGSIGVTAVTCASGTAIDEGLHSGNHITLLAVSENLDAISNARECSMCPARAAVLGDVLIEISGQETWCNRKFFSIFLYAVRKEKIKNKNEGKKIQ
jgi:hypothetical protein